MLDLRNRPSTNLILTCIIVSVLASCEDDTDPILAPSFIDVIPKTLDFGRAPVGSSIRKELVVLNSGQKMLNVTGVKFVGDTNAFSLTQVPGVVAANDKKSGLLEFRPDAVGSFEAMLVIESDADNNTAFQIMVAGEGVDNTFCGDCASPPQNSCLTETDLEIYDLVGACSDGECKYQKRVIACADRCDNGQCVNGPIPIVNISLSPDPAYTFNALTVNSTVTNGNVEGSL